VAVNSKGHASSSRVEQRRRSGVRADGGAASSSSCRTASSSEIGKGLYAWSFAHTVRIDKDDKQLGVDKGSDMIVRFESRRAQSSWCSGRRKESPQRRDRSRGEPYFLRASATRSRAWFPPAGRVRLVAEQQIRPFSRGLSRVLFGEQYTRTAHDLTREVRSAARKGPSPAPVPFSATPDSLRRCRLATTNSTWAIPLDEQAAARCSTTDGSPADAHDAADLSVPPDSKTRKRSTTSHGVPARASRRYIPRTPRIRILHPPARANEQCSCLTSANQRISATASFNLVVADRRRQGALA